MPLEALSLEERFWGKVWRCSHHWPCKKCCWPWLASLRTGLYPGTWKDHPSFHDARLTPATVMYVHRVAYLLVHRTLLLPGIAVCHQCHFSPCCNPAHLCAGTQGDNVRVGAARRTMARDTP
jgi:hypothetical protein